MKQTTKKVLVAIGLVVLFGVARLLPGAQEEAPKTAPVAVASVAMDAGAWGIRMGTKPEPSVAAVTDTVPEKKSKWEVTEDKDSMYG